MARDALDSDSIVGGFAWLLLGYMLIYYLRDRAATDQGGYVFEGTEPTQTIIGEGVDILAPMQVSPNGQAFIKSWEKLRLTRYRDGSKWAIGWGHDIQPGENIPNTITADFAEQLFEGDVSTAAAAVNNALTVQVTQNQFDALASLAYNIGAGAFGRSTMVKDLNAGDFQGAADQFTQWAKNANLLSRREAEQGMFNGGSA